MVVCKVTEKVQLGEVAVGAELALGEPLVVKLRVLVHMIDMLRGKTCSLVTHSIESLLLAKPILLDDKVHVYGQLGWILLEQVQDNIVLETVVKQQGDSGVASKGTAWTLERFILWQVLIHSLPQMEQGVFEKVGLGVE